MDNRELWEYVLATMSAESSESNDAQGAPGWKPTEFDVSAEPGQAVAISRDAEDRGAIIVTAPTAKAVRAIMHDKFPHKRFFVLGQLDLPDSILEQLKEDSDE